MPARSNPRKVVKYLGTSDARVIEKADWESIGIDDQDRVVWSWRNDWAVPADDLSEGALNYVKNKDDTGLKIIDTGSVDRD